MECAHTHVNTHTHAHTHTPTSRVSKPIPKAVYDWVGQLHEMKANKGIKPESFKWAQTELAFMCLFI